MVRALATVLLIVPLFQWSMGGHQGNFAPRDECRMCWLDGDSFTVYIVDIIDDLGQLEVKSV